MNRILESTSSAEWWFSVVIVGLLVGIVGTYLVRMLDRLTGGVSTLFTAKSARAKARREEAARLMMMYQHRIEFAIAQRTKHQLMAIWLAVIGSSGVCMAYVGLTLAERMHAGWDKQLPSLALGCCAYLVILYGCTFQWKANDTNFILADVLERLDQQQGATKSATAPQESGAHAVSS